MEIERIPLEEKEDLRALFASDEYKLLSKYIRALKKDIVAALVDARIEEGNLVYLKGQVDGADRLIRLLDEFKRALK